MVIILLLALIIAFSLNLGAPSAFSNMSSGALVLEFMATLVISFLMIIRMVPNKTAQSRFVNCFLFGYTISLLILHFYWTPVELVSAGFDSARYYNYAATMTRGGVVLDGLNYWGVVFFYYVLFTVFGLDPLVPLFLNVLLVLYAILLLAKFLCRVGVPYKMSALLLLIPEIMYYNDMSSREILCMVFGVIVILNFYKVYNKESSVFTMILSVFILMLMIVIRPPYGIGVILVMALYMLFSARKKGKVIFYGLILVAVAVVGVGLAGNIGDTGSDVGQSLSSTIEDRVGGDNTMGDDFIYSQNSMAAKLIPHNPVEFVVYGIIRTFAYVIITPGDITDPINSFNIITDKTGYIEWTTLFMMLLIPGVYKTIRNSFKVSSEIKLLVIAFLVFFFLVGVFNTNLIQQRYRLVYDLFYFSLAIIYLTERKRSKKKYSSCPMSNDKITTK